MRLLVVEQTITSNQEVSTSQTEQSENGVQSTEKISISVGFENNMKDSMSKAVENWAENLAEISGGTMELVLYPD